MVRGTSGGTMYVVTGWVRGVKRVGLRGWWRSEILWRVKIFMDPAMPAANIGKGPATMRGNRVKVGLGRRGRLWDAGQTQGWGLGKITLNQGWDFDKINAQMHRR